MKNSEKEIEDFFAEMRNSDSRLEVPDFHQLAGHRKKRVPPFISAAASLLIIILSGWYLLTDEEPPAAVEIIVTEKQEIGSMSLIASDGTIEEWESPTQSLIDDF